MPEVWLFIYNPIGFLVMRDSSIIDNTLDAGYSVAQKYAIRSSQIGLVCLWPCLHFLSSGRRHSYKVSNCQDRQLSWSWSQDSTYWNNLQSAIFKVNLCCNNCSKILDQIGRQLSITRIMQLLHIARNFCFIMVWFTCNGNGNGSGKGNFH